MDLYKMGTLNNCGDIFPLSISFRGHCTREIGPHHVIVTTSGLGRCGDIDIE